MFAKKSCEPSQSPGFGERGGGSRFVHRAALRMLTTLDGRTRECHLLRVNRSLRSGDVLAWLKKAIEEVQHWLARSEIKTICIDLGSPWQNGFVESFDGRFREECLNREQLCTLTEARVVIEDFRREYNQLRPHNKLGYLSPATFAAQRDPFPSPVGLRPPSDGNGQTSDGTNKTSPED